MRQNCKNTIISLIKHIKNIQQNRNCTQAMLIVDQQTSLLLSSVVYYFFALGVKNITKISLKKKPQPNCIGIYYLSPKSLKLINEDFKAQPIYHSINILISQEATTQIMKELASQSKIMQRLAFFGQLKLNTKYFDANLAIICDQEQLFKRLVKNDLKKVSIDFANKLFESIISGYGNNFVLKAYYQNNQHISDILSHLSSRHQQHQKRMANLSKEQVQAGKPQTVIRLLLVDRKIDVVSPIVRNFSYFAMVSQFFNVDYQNNKITLKQGQTIQLLFDDDIFLQYKNLHIFNAQNTIEPSFKQFKADNKAAQANKQGTVNKADIKHIIRDIPEYNKKVASYQSQISLMHDISSLSKSEDIPQIGEVQQMIISGLTGHGEQIKDKKIYQKSMEFCTKILNKDYALKIYLLLILCNDLPQSEKKGLIMKIKQNAKFNNLGVFLQTKLTTLIHKPIKLKPSFKKEKVFLDMHESLVSAIVSEIIEKGTSKTVSLMVIGTQIKVEQSKFEKIQKKQIKQWLVCMFGGLSINQISHLERLQTTYQNIKINMITDKVFTTWNYIDALPNLFI